MDSLTNSNVPTMSSQEIADLVGSRHDSVRRTIERLAERGTIQVPPLVEVKNHLNQTIYHFQVCKRDSFVVVAQLSPEFTAALVDRWQELEAKVQVPALPNFNDPAASARAWAEQFELKQAAQEALAIAAPKAEFVDRYVDGTGLKGFRQVAKLLGAKENELREFLVDSKIQYRLGGEWCAYQNHIDAGRFQVRTGTSSHSDHVYNEAKFTPKGVAWLAGLWAQHNLRNAE